MKIIRWIVPCLLIAIVATSVYAAPVGPGFTYQGQLLQSGVPYNGTVSMRFTVWDAPSDNPPIGGNPTSLPQVITGITVTNGLFVVTLNDANQFGPPQFTGEARWLQIEVCSDPACSNPGTLLAPRQPLGSTPYAQLALGPWKPNTSDVYYSGGNVGINTSTPRTNLDVVGNQYLGPATPNGIPLTILGPNSPTDQNSAQDVSFSFASAGSARVRSYRGGSWDTYLQFLTNRSNAGSDAPQPRMTIDASGNVGIGSTSPQHLLQIGGGFDAAYGLGPSDAAPNAGYLRFGDNTGWKLHIARAKESSGGAINTNTTGALMTVVDNGNVGIGTTSPAQKLQVVGNICATGTIGSCSDGRLKEHIAPLDRGLKDVLALRGVSFTWKPGTEPASSAGMGKQIGLIAQEVEKVCPEVVQTGSDGYKAIDYSRLAPLLIEAIKELNGRNEALQERINALTNTLESHKADRRKAAESEGAR